MQYYSDKNAQVYNGLLTIESKKENLNNMRYTSTRLVSKKKFKYGIIEYRAKLPKGRGTVVNYIIWIFWKILNLTTIY